MKSFPSSFFRSTLLARTVRPWAHQKASFLNANGGGGPPTADSKKKIRQGEDNRARNGLGMPRNPAKSEAKRPPTMDPGIIQIFFPNLPWQNERDIPRPCLRPSRWHHLTYVSADCEWAPISWRKSCCGVTLWGFLSYPPKAHCPIQTGGRYEARVTHKFPNRKR